MKCAFVIFFALLFSFSSYAQDISKMLDETPPKKDWTNTFATFKGFRIVNAQTNETVKKHTLVFSISHRFGDIASSSGGIHSLYGLDVASDIRFSFNYGVTDRLTLGDGRARGIDPMNELYDGNIKFKLLQQTENNKVPLAITLFGDVAISTRRSSSDIFSEGSYPNFNDRLSYIAQAIVARKFSPSLSLELLPTYSHRNFVSYNDENDLFSIGAGLRMKVTKRLAIIADYFHTFSKYRDDLKDVTTGDKVFFDPLSVGFEIETGGHVFTINFTNSTGIIENEFIPYTRSSWLEGEFRLGFNITRSFVFGKR